MGFILTLLLVSVIIALFFYLPEGDRAEAGATFIVCFLISAVAVAFVIGVSTYNYYDLHGRLAKHETYQQAVKAYIKAATPTVGSGPNISVSGNEITDFKYQSYQGELAELLQFVRYNAAKYNENLASKRAMALSWYWCLLIVEPDDWMKPLVIE